MCCDATRIYYKQMFNLEKIVKNLKFSLYNLFIFAKTESMSRIHVKVIGCHKESMGHNRFKSDLFYVDCKPSAKM